MKNILILSCFFSFLSAQEITLSHYKLNEIFKFLPQSIKENHLSNFKSFFVDDFFQTDIQAVILFNRLKKIENSFKITDFIQQIARGIYQFYYEYEELVLEKTQKNDIVIQAQGTQIQRKRITFYCRSLKVIKDVPIAPEMSDCSIVALEW